MFRLLPARRPDKRFDFGIFSDLFGRAGEEDAASFQHAGPVRHREGDLGILLHEQDAFSRGVDFLDNAAR